MTTRSAAPLALALGALSVGWAFAQESPSQPKPERRAARVAALEDRIAVLEKQVAELKDATSAQPRRAERPLPTVGDIKIFALENAEAQSVVGALTTLFIGRRDGDSLRLAADMRTNSVIATGNPEELETVAGILLRLDEMKPASTTTPAF